MTVSPSAWLSNSLLAVESLLCNCASFRTLTGTANVAAARLICIWQTARSELPALSDSGPKGYATIQLINGTDSEPALRTVSHVNSVAVSIRWRAQTSVDGDTDKDKAIRELNTFGALLKEIAGLVGTGSDYPIKCSREWEAPEMVSDDEGNGFTGEWDAAILFSWDI